jgi:hypothetical protein
MYCSIVFKFPNIEADFTVYLALEDQSGRTPENTYICKVPRCLANIEKFYDVRIL